MRTRRARLALLVPAAALVAVLGGTSAVAAPAASHSARLRWHTIKLLNGWKSASTSSLKTGTPAWAVRDGVVYLRGAVKQPDSGGSARFGTLPKVERPARNLYIQIYTNQDAPGTVFVGRNGELEAYNGNADAFASLANVSFQAAKTRTHTLTLKNGWVSSESSYGTGNPGYDISHGVVYLSGSMHGGTSTLAFVLPRAARPARTLYVSVYAFDGSTGYLRILSNGSVYVFGSASTSYTSLASVSFPVSKTRWHAFKLLDHWKSGAKEFGTAVPEYAVVNGIDYLNGSMYQPVVSNGLWAELPKPARSAHTLEIEVWAWGGTTGVISLAGTDGLATGMPFSNSEALTSLAGIAYPPSE